MKVSLKNAVNFDEPAAYAKLSLCLLDCILSFISDQLPWAIENSKLQFEHLTLSYILPVAECTFSKKENHHADLQ